MLKSQMLTLLQKLDAQALEGGDGPASPAEEAKVEEAPVAKEAPKPAAKKSAAGSKKSAAAPKAAAAAPAPEPVAPATKKAAAAKPAAAKAVTAAKPQVESKPVSTDTMPASTSTSYAEGTDAMSAARLALRAKRFGTSEVKEKLESRAERFAIPSKLPKDPLTKRAEEAQKREEKAAQRAADIKAHNERAARFGLPLKVDQQAENEKKRARSERFKEDTAAKKPKLEETA